MSAAKFTGEFKRVAVGQVEDRGYAWLCTPICPRALEVQRQTVLRKKAWGDSDEV